MVGTPTGTIPTTLNIAYGRGDPWSNVTVDAPFHEKYGNPYGIAAMLMAMEVVETGGRMIWNTGGSGAFGIMQIKEANWGWLAKQLGVSLQTREGQIATAAAILGKYGKGNNPRERFLYSYYPVLDKKGNLCLDCKGEDGGTPRQYLEDIDTLIGIINAAGAPVADDPSTIFLKKNPFPKPVIYDLATDYERFGLPNQPLTKAMAKKIINNRFENRSGGSAQFIVNHIQDGTTPGSLNWWAVGAGVQASSTVMANRDGSILKIVPEQHGPWTNGDVCSPTPKSAALRALGGNPNCYSLTLEAEGSPGISEVSYTDKQLQAILWQFADWMVRYNLPLSNVLSHASINFCDRQNCPGEANMLRVLSELKKAATAAPSEGGISQETLDELVDTLDKIVINNEGDIRSLQETNKSLRAVITALGNLKGVA